MTTFVLVHGAFHGAWCWQPLAEHLAATGYDTISIDLPIDEPSAKWDDHVATVLDGARHAKDAVLVGHSRAGRLIPLVLERRSFDGVIYIAASLPKPPGTPPRQSDNAPMLHTPTVGLAHDEMGRQVCPKERANELYYHDCSPEIRDWAVARLRPQFDIEYPQPSARPRFPSMYIAGTDDRAVTIEWMRAASGEILGHAPTELPAGHCPFLSVPQDLANAFAGFAAGLPAGAGRRGS